MKTVRNQVIASDKVSLIDIRCKVNHTDSIYYIPRGCKDQSSDKEYIPSHRNANSPRLFYSWYDDVLEHRKTPSRPWAWDFLTLLNQE